MKLTSGTKALMRFAMGCLFLTLCNYAGAQTTTEEWKAAAIKKYPTLNLQGSTLNKRFLAAYNERLKSDPDFIKKPDWMMKLADELAPKPPKPDTFNERIEDTEEFFKTFIEKWQVKPRDQFETEAEYNARLPKMDDPNKVYYFEISLDAKSAYDIKKEQMTLFAGYLAKNPKYKAEGQRFEIHKKVENLEPYDASNAFGKAVTVKNYVRNHYIFLSDKDKVIIPPAPNSAFSINLKEFGGHSLILDDSGNRYGGLIAMS